MRTEPPLVAPIFRSDGQARLLAALLLEPAELSITDLGDRASLAYPTVHREVERLINAGILRDRTAGRTRLVSANPDSPLTSPLREILTVSAGPAPLFARELAAIDGVEAAFLYGSFAARARGVNGPAPADIDLMVVGTPDPEAVYAAAERVENAVRRPVNPTIVTMSQLTSPSAFLQHVRENPIVPVLGATPWP
jgi:DNA-binding Lrp family transcriptional regulator